MTGAIVCFSVAIVAVIVAMMIKPKPNPKQNKKRPALQDIQPKALTPIDLEKIVLDIPERLFNRLLELVGDRENAIKGILLTMKAYPKSSAKWACSKEIADIENMKRFREGSHSRRAKIDRDTDRYL